MLLLKAAFTCVILILSCGHLINSRPVPVERGLAVGANYQLDMQRAQRQVVQPTWLTDKGRPLMPTDGTVRINQQNLRETAELRDAIQKAVNEDRFAVDIDQEQPPKNQPNVQSIPLRPPPPPAPQFGPLPLGPFNPGQWSLPAIAPWLTTDQRQPNPMQRMWSDLMRNTRRMWNR